MKYDLHNYKYVHNDYTVYVVYLAVILIWRFGEFYWFAKFKSCHFNSHTRNELIYLPFRQIKMMPTLFFKQIANIFDSPINPLIRYM